MPPLKNVAEPLDALPPPVPGGSAGSIPFRREHQSVNDACLAAGVITDRRRIVANRALNAISIAAPAAGAAAAIISLPVMPPSLITISIFIAFFFINALGVSIGLHRYFTHRAFRPMPWFAVCLAVAGSWAFQGPIARWVADHRRHHRFADEQFDPHSPYWTDSGETGGKFSGWWHAHLLWMLTGRPSCEQRYAKDVYADPVESWFTRNYWLVALSGLVLPTLIGYAAGGPTEAAKCFLWAGCLRVSLLHQITWSVNSFGHMIGDKVSGARGEARDNRLLAILLIGEGLHSHHHRFPLSAVNQPSSLDTSGLVLRVLERLGVVELGGAQTSG